MSMKPSAFRIRSQAARLRPIAAAAFVAGCFVAAGHAQEDNPFARPGAAQAAPAATASPLDSLELRGVTTLGERTIVTLFDTATSRSTVVALDSTVNGLTVTDYQPGDDSVRVQSGGRERRVQIKKAQIVTMATPPPAPVPPPGAPQAVGSPPVPGSGQPPAVDDQEVRARMERVAQEIRRRREMRRQIMERAQQQPQGAQQ